MENSKLFPPFGTQGDTAHSTTEDMEGLTTGKHDKLDTVVRLTLCYQLKLMFPCLM